MKQGYSSDECEHEIQIFDILNNKNSELWLATNMGFYTLNLKTDSIKYVGIKPASKFVFSQRITNCALFGTMNSKCFQVKIFRIKFSVLKSQN